MERVGNFLKLRESAQNFQGTVYLMVQILEAFILVSELTQG